MPPQHERVGVPGATLACTAHGDPGAPVVICLHGFPDCARSFRHQVGPLTAAGLRVIVPALRGYAPSSVATDGHYDPRALGGDVLALADHFSPGRAVGLVGHDWGAIATYAACALAPGRVAAAATLAVPPPRSAAQRWVWPDQLYRSRYMLGFQLRGHAERRLLAHDLAQVDALWAAWSPGPVDPGELDAVKASLRAHPEAVLAYYRFLSSPRALRRSVPLIMARVQVPGVYIHGLLDGCVAEALARGLRRGWPAAAYVPVPGAGHFVHQERPDVVSRALVRHLVGALDPHG